MGAATMLDSPERCLLEHQFFAAVGDIQFRRSPVDGVATMALSLGERDASIPLRSLQRELAIAEDTADGRMFGLIGESLDFVSFLLPGDRLPSEVRTGEASWQPETPHVHLAAARLRLRLVAWLSPPGRWTDHATDDAALAALIDDQALRDDVVAVASVAVERLRLPGAAAVTRLLNELAHELAYVDTLRSRLLGRVEKVVVMVGKRSKARRQASALCDTLVQVHRLAQVAYKQIRNRFDDLDARTSDIASLLGNAEAHRSFIRSNRDWLYRSQRAWEPTLTQWEHEVDVSDTGVSGLVNRTYQFLAPRFMPTTEWQVHRQARVREAAVRPMTW